MIVKDDGLKYAKLIHVSVDNGKTGNSNKVYIMTEENDGRVKCEYGRVGKDLTVVFKPISDWDKIYRNKTSPRKGYTDVTDMIVEAIAEDVKSGGNSTIADITDSVVKRLFDDLMAFANKSIQKNYKVTQDAVTEAQIDAAQEVLTNAFKTLKKGVAVKEVNDLLIQLYTIIPRKMKDVRDFMITSTDTTSDLTEAKEFLANEQDTLDTMAGQVKLLNQQKDANVTIDGDDAIDTDEMTVLDQMGLKVEVETDPEALALVNKLLGSNAHQAKKILKCINTKTQATFDAHLNKSKSKRRRFYWHGSRNENIFNIVQTGLMIRPSGAIHTGSMFGDGIYFANKAQKSIGYSSLNGSYWVKGNSNKAYLILYDVHTGKQKHINNHNSSCYSLSQKVLDGEGYDSVYAHGGVDLRNDEFIIYTPKQCTIAYLIEIGH